MQAKVVSITKSLVEGKELTAEDLIVYTARVSNPSNQLNTATSDRLLRYLIKQKHWSPLDMVDFAVEVQTSRAIAAQILRHWSFDFQEFSQRYAEAVDIEPIELREAGSTTRQGSIEGDFNPLLSVVNQKTGSKWTGSAQEAVDSITANCVELYQALLSSGVAKECARMVLPLATQTTIIMKASVRSWLFYMAQRLDAHAQLEHRQLAELILPLFQTHFPNVCKAFFENE